MIPKLRVCWRCSRVLQLLLVGLACGWAAPGLAADSKPSDPRRPPTAPSPREWALAQCVAALDTQTEALASQVKAGRQDLRGLLRARLKAGAALIGQAYLDGERDEERSQALLDQARDQHRSLPPAELLARQNRCAAEGDKLLAAADPVSRAVVSRVADRRMKKLLDR